MPTLLRVLIDATGMSRRRAFEAIRGGRVSVEGAIRVDPSAPYEGGTLSLEGTNLAPAEAGKLYLLLNKPAGFVTTLADELGRRTVIDLIPPRLRATGLHPVGRLDRDTSGLLLLTNDGALTFRLTHPSHEVEKEYWVRLADRPAPDFLAALRLGVVLDGRLRRPVKVERLARATGFHVAVTLREGRKRQVRRMFAALGARVLELRRRREGAIELGELPEGAVRPLSEDELASLLTAERDS